MPIKHLSKKQMQWFALVQHRWDIRQQMWGNSLWVHEWMR